MCDDVWSALGFSPNYGRQLFPLAFFILQSLPASQAVRGVRRLLAVCTCASKRAFTNAEARALLLETVMHPGVGLRHLCLCKALQVILSTDS